MAPYIDDESLARLAKRVGAHLMARGATIATAESCTGGFIAKVLTDIAGSSAYLLEGFVTYSNSAKRARLGVAPALLSKHGAVSEAVARAMARGALQRARSRCAVAVTGIAGPGGAVAGKPVGTVWIGWATKTPRGIRVRTQGFHFRGDRDSVRRKTVRAALRGLLR